MGILTPLAGITKTYGIFGAISIAGGAVKAGYLDVAAEMDVSSGGTSTKKYMIVSVWANNYLATAPTNGITFDFSSTAWDTALTTDWAAPAQPAAPTQPNSFASTYSVNL